MTKIRNKAAQTATALLDFITRSPTPFQAVEQLSAELDAAGFEAVSTEQNWGDSPKGQRFYFTHNQSSLIAVSLQAPLEEGFRLIGAHTDSPCLKIKPNAVKISAEGMVQLGVEVYGGALLAPWFDRDLSIAGRVSLVDKEGKLTARLIDFKNPIATIPSLAIHMNREANTKHTINKQKHLPPVLCQSDELDFNSLILKQIKQQYGETYTECLSFELSLYDTQAPAIIGLNEDYVASARLDNLLSSYIATQAMLNHDSKTNCIVVLNDHEEVGSKSASGAAGPFLEAVIRRLCGSEESYQRAISKSMLISADNAHAVHPNYSELHEPEHQPHINSGPVIKINHNQRYASNSETVGIFAQLCKQNEIPYQQFVVRSDLGCGSTIGPITATELGVRTLDIGAPQLGMHSIRELAGVEDIGYLLNALTAFVNLDSLPDAS
ncbi:MAG: aspartyl aminopeptidase [Neolewinella sp.]|jgi:aspartyl aminopeptidase